MSLPGNGIFVVQGEMAMLVTAMRRSTRWGSHSFPNEEYDVLMRTFQDLKTILSQVDDLRLLDPATYLGPFLEVVRSKETTGPVTSLALSAIHKFLSYGLIDPTHPSVPATVEDIADAVTHARFVGTDHSSDGVVLMKILQIRFYHYTSIRLRAANHMILVFGRQFDDHWVRFFETCKLPQDVFLQCLESEVLRTLMLSPEGAMLTDESVCEIMLSCFRICFETRLTELLRRNAEQCLRDMTQLIFMRLPQFPPEDASTASFSTVGLSLKKREKTSKKKSLTSLNSTHSLERKSSLTEPTSATTVENESESDASKTDNIIRHSQDKNLMNEAEITIEPVDSVKSPGKKHGRHSSMDLANGSASIVQLLEKCVNADAAGDAVGPEGGPGDTGQDPPEPDGIVASTVEACITPPEEQKEDIQDKQDIQDIEDIQDKVDIQDVEDIQDKVDIQDIEDIQDKEDKPAEYVNHRGIRFTPQEDAVQLQPYGLVCVRELFRFLISLCNPLDAQNTSGMVHLGLSLVGAALELAADQLAAYPSLLRLLQDPLCRNLICLLSTERISIFALDLQVSFLLFEALRFHLKFQMEAFFKKIIEIVSADTTKAIYELKEIHHLALESLSQLFRIPGLCAELYLNYDCDVYSMNVFEELTKLLSKNVVSSTAHNIHSLSLEALLTIIEAIEMGCNQAKECKSEMEVVNGEEEKEAKYGRGGHVCLELGGMDDASVVSDHVTHDISQYFGGGRTGRHKVISDLPSEAELDNIRNMKTWVTQGTELFNQKPERGVEYLQEHGVLAAPLDPREVAAFLRENPDLDKKMIGEYICKRSSRDEDEDGGVSVLGAFADSFEYAGLRIDQALRLYLETFRLPGEAPLIFLVMERFAERWHSSNGEPFANTDAAFRLAYAVIMLNMDQHNHNAKKLNVPMNAEDFVRNLRNCNGSGDFDQAMLEEIYHSIKNEEMVMPAERVGPVRDAYLWRVLQRRGAAPAARYRAAPRGHPHRARLYVVACPPTVTALSAAFERAAPPTAEELAAGDARDCAALLALAGLERCAALLARLPPDALTVDTLLLTLCKFTGLLAPNHANYIAIGVSLGQSSKAQLALRRACAVAARHADCVRDAWRHLLEIVNTLYIGRLLPKCLVEAEDYLAPNGTVSLIREAARGSEAGLFSSIYSYIALGDSGMRAPTPHERALIDAAAECVAKCNLPGLLVAETKFLQLESLQELVRAMVTVGTPPDSESIQLNPQLEDITIFFLELLGQTLIQNRDRLLSVWEAAGPHIQRVVWWAGALGAATLTRAVTALLRTAARLMRCDACAAPVLHHLTLLFSLPYKLFYQQADVISCGVYEIVKTSAQNVHAAREWDVVFALLAAAGAGAWPPDAERAAALSASSRSDGSEDESVKRPTSVSSESDLSHSPQTQGWILVKSESASLEAGAGSPGGADARVRLRPHRAAALARCCEALALVIRDVAHVTPYNCRAAVRAVRLFAEAAHRDGKKSGKSREGRRSRPSSGRRRYDDSSDEETDTLDQYHMVSIQLLDLMHTLHSRTAQIFKWWRDEADQGQSGEDYDLWEVAWQPLLQGIAHFCTDRRKQVANSAIAYLQRALLVPGLAAMGGGGWEACFLQVLFPLLAALPRDALAGSRANTIMCKVFLQHLSALSLRPTFGAVWARVVAAQRALLAAPPDDPRAEAALESLKNMILVMDSVRIFSNGDGYNELWYMTWDKINEFLPNLKEELFPQVKDNAKPTPSHMQPTLPPTLPTLIPVGANSTPTILPVPSPPNAQSPTNFQRPIHVQTSLPSPILGQIPHSPVNIVQTPPMVSSTPTLVAPTPISGMVPIRNQLYDQAGLTSSVLLQPLNEMISTPIGMSVQPQMPMLYPQAVDQRPQKPADHTTPPDTRPDQPPVSDDLIISENIEKSELYSEYITNPYNQIKDVSKEATLYDPEDPNSIERNPLISVLDKKSYSANATPMHAVNKAQFGSSDNVRQESGMFNFTSYFGSLSESVAPGSEVFDTLMSAQEG